MKTEVALLCGGFHDPDGTYFYLTQLAMTSAGRSHDARSIDASIISSFVRYCSVCSNFVTEEYCNDSSQQNHAQYVNPRD